MSQTFWVYKPLDADYYIARPNSFGWYERVLDFSSGGYALQLVQGIPMTAPPAWDWKRIENGRTFVGYDNKIYDITELTCGYYPKL
jgi:hypothetical protein